MRLHWSQWRRQLQNRRRIVSLDMVYIQNVIVVALLALRGGNVFSQLSYSPYLGTTYPHLIVNLECLRVY